MDPVVLLSVIFGTTSVFFYALSAIFIRAGIRDASPVAAMFVSLSVNLVALWIVVFAFTDFRVDLWRWRYFILAGLMAPGLGRLFNYAGIDRLGVNVNAPIVYSNPLVSVAGAIVFLGEQLSAVGLVGGVLVIAGGAYVGSERGDGSTSFDRRHLVFPVIAALVYGLSHLLRKVGIDLVQSPLIASAVTITTSWLLAAGYVLGSGLEIDLNRRQWLSFSMSGLASSVAIPMLYLAFEVGLVVVVSPLMNLAPLFVIAISFFVFREEELFSHRVVLGTITIVCGITLLTAFGSVS
ncbi:EamA family transporter [Halobellus sp. GM3]|uniref:EamA family transporter n=1 Tax=Halobellus sp. GM3 TaxID=3458410 RepID=UPI00403D83D1